MPLFRYKALSTAGETLEGNSFAALIAFFPEIVTAFSGEY